MPDIVNVGEAKAHLSELLDRAAAGEEIVIARAGMPLARLAPLEKRAPRHPGALADWDIPDDLFLEPADPADLDAAERLHTDEFGVAKP